MFPFSKSLSIDAHLNVDSALVKKHIWPLLTEERRQKIERVVSGRCYSVTTILENIYDRGNASAVMRTAEALGFASVHSIEPGDKFKESNRVTAGSDKWVELTRYKDTKSCVEALKKQGYKICVTSLEASRPLSEIDFTVPCAVVLGNEKEGVSKEMLDLADERMIIPMVGFVQSYNISVAGALCLYHIFNERYRLKKSVGDLTEEQKEILSAIYALRTQDSAKDILREMFSRNQLA